MQNSLGAIFVYTLGWKFSSFCHRIASNIRFCVFSMGRNKEITPRKRAIIAQYYKDGLKQAEICRRLKMPRSTVSQLLGQFKKTGSSSAGKSSGRPRVTSLRDDPAIARSRINPTYCSLQIKMETGVKGSCKTIRRRLLSEFNLAARRSTF